MAVHVYAPLLGKRLRITKLDKCGNPLPAGTEDSALVTTGFITLNMTSETEDGTEIIQRNAAGNICINEKRPNSFKRFSIDIDFCEVNPALISLVTNAELYYDWGTDEAGFTVGEGEIDNYFALELWTGMSGVTCGSGDEASGYILLPKVTAGVLGDITIDGENAINFKMTGASTAGGNGWGKGPYKVLKDNTGSEKGLPQAIDPFDHFFMIDTALAPPPAADDMVAIPTI